MSQTGLLLRRDGGGSAKTPGPCAGAAGEPAAGAPHACVAADATEGAAAHSPPGGSVISRHVNFDDPALVEALGGSDEQGKRCREFFLHLALCHTVVTEVVYGERSLSASSPDETALVAGAERFGYRFIERHHDTVELQGPDGEPLQYEVLDVLEFSSARRRMSIVVRNSQTRAISLLSKGADTVMLPLLASGQEELVAQTEAHMHDHSNDGLRTLVIASKELSEEEYLSWSERYRRAASDLDEVEKKSREEPNAIDDQCDAMESRMRLLGSTALEDKLQEGVPACIADLVKAGIATWMLTGDKEETAINIAYACELLDSTTTVVVVGLKTHPNVEDITRALREATAAAEESMELSANAQRGRRALVIDGGALGLLFGAAPDAPACQLEFLRFTQTCATVVACRCAPAQKAKLVRLVRRNVRGVSALAIGDGANDVAMIQTAHVGVGISGKEGMLAVNAADFAIAQFRFLREMLLVQGRHNYRRIAVTVYYVFYKNIMFTLVIFWAQFFAAFSGTKWNLEAGNQLYNVLLTMFPILWFSVFDKDVSDETSLALPQLYHLGPGNHFYFNWRATLRWIFQAIYESLAIALLCVFSLDGLSPDGESPGLYLIGACTITLAIVVPNLKLILWFFSWNIWSFVLIGFEVVLWWGVGGVVASEIKPENRGTSGEFIAQFVLGWYKLWGNVNELGTFWLLMLLVPAVVLLPQVFYSFYMRRFHPQFRDLAMECEYHGLPIDALKAWQIPAGQRQRRLVKGAPRPLYQASRFQRLCASLCGSKAKSESARSTATRA